MATGLINKLIERQNALGASDRAFAKHLRINRQMWRWLKTGERKPGWKILGAICQRYPDLTTDALFFVANRVSSVSTASSSDNTNNAA